LIVFFSFNVEFEFTTVTSPNDTIGFNEKSRRIEQGAKIVVVAGINLVLQMPRGNLETIYPRALVLSKIHTFIDKYFGILILANNIEMHLLPVESIGSI
jgi:elongator complex protein 1